MKKLLILLAMGAIIVPVWVLSTPAQTPIPHEINYQGMLIDLDTGDPLNGTPDITFKIYNHPSGGNLKWEETHVEVPVSNGLFNVILGSATPIDLTFYEESQYWLDITVDGEHMPSRLEFTSVAFAYRAQMADTALYAAAVPEGDLDDRYVNVIGSDSVRYTSASGWAFHVKSYNGDAIRIYAPASGTGDGIYMDTIGDNAIEINNTGTNGIAMDDIHGRGISITDVDDDGIYMDDIMDYGIYIDDVANHAIWLNDGGACGVYINDAAATAFYAKLASYGMYVDSTTGGDGVWVDYGSDDGFSVTHAHDDGLYVGDADDDGVYVSNADGDGMYVYHADRYGLYIYDSDDNGIHVSSADKNGIEAHGTWRGGLFYSGQASSYGVTAHSYNNLSGNPGLYVYGYGYATGGFSKSVPGPSGDVPAFMVSSADVELIASGTGALTAGQAQITFEPTFQEAISPEVPVKVVLTAQGAPSGLLYVASKSNQGFSVERLEIPDLAMKSDDVTFDWIAIGRQKGYEERPQILMAEEEESTADQMSREEQMRAEEQKNQEKLEQEARARQEMKELQAQKEPERIEREKEREEESTE